MDATKPLPQGSRILFPLAVLEVKLSGIAQSPAWLDAILESNYVVSAYKFSKFMHGMSIFLFKLLNFVQAQQVLTLSTVESFHRGLPDLSHIYQEQASNTGT